MDKAAVLLRAGGGWLTYLSNLIKATVHVSFLLAA
jgi:hypothetical protein